VLLKTGNIGRAMEEIETMKFQMKIEENDVCVGLELGLMLLLLGLMMGGLKYLLFCLYAD
jgi:hypothetical protein